MPNAVFTKVREQQPIVGISACLIGENVRYDGGNKFHQLIQQELSPWLNLKALCPEVEAGLGVPRPPVNLIKTANGIEALGVKDHQLNVTQQLKNTSINLVNSYCMNFCAYIVKARSPSCGAGSTPIYNKMESQQLAIGDGLFVQTLKAALPNLLIVDESCFSDIQSCNEFVQQCYQLQIND